MPIPDYETMMLPVLRAFESGAKSVNECLPLLIRDFGISD
jgi:restriction system protein